jgi:myo-inositol-1(or 4)-monophosphatase
MDRYDFIVAQVREAGKLLLQLRKEKFETLEKGGDPRDIVTSVDLTVNDLLIGKIKESYPEDAIHSEEGGGITGASRVWTIDPIDGSSNFSRGIPHFAICLAFLEDGEPKAGAVYNPVTDELFSFKKGGGAFLNGMPVRVSGETELKNSFVFLHAGRKQELWDWGGASYTKLLSAAKKVANYGGSALDACFVASGRIEANVYGRLTTLDIAAAIGILVEAGGRVVNEKGEPIVFSAEPSKVVMTNSESIEKAILGLLF